MTDEPGLPGSSRADQSSPDPEATLGLVAGLRTRLDATGHVRVDTPLGGVVDAGTHGLAILALFMRPRTAREAMVALGSVPEPRPDPRLAEATITRLVEAGAIVASDPDDGRYGWTDPAEHARMLDDVRRTDAFTAALRECVRPDDVVLDVGTGSGILAMTAALAGARHVYAVEASDIAKLAGRAFADNGLSDRITLLEGWSAQVRLPERATLLVSEIIGAEPLEEDILGTTLDARRRLLTPDARLIPARLRLEVRAVSVAQLSRWASRVEPASIGDWRRRYGVDLGALWEARRRVPLPWAVDGMTVATWPVLGPTLTLAEIDLATFESASIEAEAEITVDRPGIVDAILLTFVAGLTDDIVLPGPPWPDAPSNWDVSVWFLPEALAVENGSRLAIRYRYGVPGQTDGLQCTLLAAAGEASAAAGNKRS